MKLSQVFLLFALASFVICADPQPANNQQQAKPTGDWSCTEDITAKVADKDSLMKLLRNGDKESLEKIYVIGIKDTARTDQETLDNTKAMELGLKTLTFKDVAAPPQGGAQAGAQPAAGAKPATPAANPATPATPAPEPAIKNPDQHKTRIEQYQEMKEKDV